MTTREIARGCGANQASIWYHFGGKKQLFLAVARLIAEEGRAALAPQLERSRKQAAVRVHPAALLEALMTAFALQLLTRADDGAAASFIARELATPGLAHSTVYELYLRDLHVEVTTLLARATARPRRAPDAIIDAHALLGTTLGFVVARKAFTYRSLRPTNSDARVNAIAQRIAFVVTRVASAKSVAARRIRGPKRRRPQMAHRGIV